MQRISMNRDASGYRIESNCWQDNRNQIESWDQWRYTALSWTVYGRAGGASLRGNCGPLSPVSATYMMPFLKMGGGAGRQRTEPFCDSPEHTDGQSPYSTGSPRCRRTRGADGPGGIHGLPRLGTVKQNQNCVFCTGTRYPAFSYRFSSGTEFRFPTLVIST